MKYLIDLTSLSSKNTGIEYVAQNAAISMIESCPNSQFVLVFNDFVPGCFDKYDNRKGVSFIKLNEKNWNKLRFYKLPQIIRHINADYNLFFAFPCPYFAPHKNAVSLIHDLTPFKFPKTQTFTQNFVWKKIIKKSISKDKHILTVSDTIKYEIANIFCRGDAKRIYPGVKNPVKSQDKSVLIDNNLISHNYILSVGTNEPRKNFDFLIDSFNELKHNNKIDEKLVIVGKVGWKNQAKSFDKDVVFLDYQNDEALSVLYKNAKLFVSPSVYEGFGLPVIEAAKHNIPLLISDISIYKETTCNQATYFNCKSKSDLKDKIELMLKSNKNNSQNICASIYDWNNYGNQLNEFLSEDNKYLCLSTCNLQVGSGLQKRVLQYQAGLTHYHNVDAYAGNSNVNYSVMKFTDIFNAIFNKQCAIKRKDYKFLVKILKSGNYSTIFIDSSLFGNVYKKLRLKFPKLKIITHFHNCEFKFFSDLYSYHKKTNLNLMSRLSLWMIKKSENLACKYSDKLIFISEEDKKSFEISNKNSSVIPSCIKDSYSMHQDEDSKEEYVMFVGSNFYANIEAVDFLRDEVAPYVNKKIVILGDDLIEKYHDSKNIVFKSYSYCAKEIFANALAFVSPIFSGSGSKIKIVEALMQGKKIIATKDSLCGYDIENMDVITCRSSQEFAQAINECGIHDKFSEKNRNLYLKKYSMDANKKYFSDI